MTLDRIFSGYMALIGLAIGALLVAVPRAGDFAIKPYFGMLIAVALFDIGCYLLRGNAPGAMLACPRGCSALWSGSC